MTRTRTTLSSGRTTSSLPNNKHKTDYCVKCNAVLNLKTAYEHQQFHDLHDDVTMTLFKILVEKGLIDEAAKAVREAGLGNSLKRLAEHQ